MSYNVINILSIFSFNGDEVSYKIQNNLDKSIKILFGNFKDKNLISRKLSVNKITNDNNDNKEVYFQVNICFIFNENFILTEDIVNIFNEKLLLFKQICNHLKLTKIISYFNFNNKELLKHSLKIGK